MDRLVRSAEELATTLTPVDLDHTLGRITAAEVRDLARATMGPDCDALFIGCSQLPTHSILAELQREFARPAWSSISATAWDARRMPVAA